MQKASTLSRGSIMFTPNERTVAEDRRGCCSLNMATISLGQTIKLYDA